MGVQFLLNRSLHDPEQTKMCDPLRLQRIALPLCPCQALQKACLSDQQRASLLQGAFHLLGGLQNLSLPVRMRGLSQAWLAALPPGFASVRLQSASVVDNVRISWRSDTVKCMPLPTL